MKVVILAGGRGARLAPYTSVLPKPLMPIGNQTILEIIIGQLARHGFDEIILCVGHLSHLIEAVLNDGRPLGARITYVKETEPLGTAGPLRAIADLPVMHEPILVMNGDVLTSLDYGALLNHHRESRQAMTIATHERVNMIDYGILEVDTLESATQVVGFREKPEFRLDVSMGVYVLEPRVLDLIPAGEYFDIPDLVHAVLARGEDIGAYRFDGFWLDIGRPEDYQAAGALWEEAMGKTVTQVEEIAIGDRESLSIQSNGSAPSRSAPSLRPQLIPGEESRLDRATHARIKDAVVDTSEGSVRRPGLKVVIFCGGLGVRMGEATQRVPKPMIPIGNEPILFHVMRWYASWGHTEFILCLGYRGDEIKRWFLSYQEAIGNNFVLDGGSGRIDLLGRDMDGWRITFVDTGLNASIGERLRVVESLVNDDEHFLATYGDGLTDAPLDAMIERLRATDKTALFLSVQPRLSYHVAHTDGEGVVSEVEAMATANIWINGGFFVLNRAIFDVIEPGEELVEKPFERLIERGELLAYRYPGFWAPMDTIKDKQMLDLLLESGQAPWRVQAGSNHDGLSTTAAAFGGQTAVFDERAVEQLDDWRRAALP